MRNLSSNWQFLLLSQVLRAKWFLHPTIAMGMGGPVSGLINRDWTGMSQTADLDQERGAFPVLAVTGNGDYHNSYDDLPEGSIAIIPLKGTMLKYGTWCDYGTEEVANQMLQGVASDKISAFVLDTDSGGGAVSAVAPMVHAIRKAKEAGKPVVASVDMACSAAYWAASECDMIVADNKISSEVGSIGVMMSFWDVRGFYEEKGYKLHTIYAPESDQKNLTFEMALKGEYDLIKTEELSPLARNFQEAVKANRGSKLNLETKGILNGKTFFSDDAKDNGLIDVIGDRSTALDIAFGLAEMNKFLKTK